MTWNEFSVLMADLCYNAGLTYLSVGVDSDVLAEAVSAERRYPAMHVSYPQIRSVRRGKTLVETWSVQISVGESVPAGDAKALSDCHDRTLTATRRVLSAIYEAANEDVFDVGDTTNIDVMDPRTSDNENGWFFEIEFTFPNCL